MSVFARFDGGLLFLQCDGSGAFVTNGRACSCGARYFPSRPRLYGLAQAPELRAQAARRSKWITGNRDYCPAHAADATRPSVYP